MKHEPKLPGEPAAGVVAGLMFGGSVFTALSYLLFKIPYPTKLDYYLEHLKAWSAMRLHQLEPHLAGVAAQGYADYLNQLPSHWPIFITAKFDLAALAGVAAGVAIAYAVGKGKPAITHITGRRLHWGIKAVQRIRRAFAAQCHRGGLGLRMHPSFNGNLSLQRETGHIFVMGGVGSGKTQIIAPLLQAAIARGDRQLVFDNKGDFSAWLPNLVLLAPWDARSHAWDIAQDCTTSQDAHELAARLIKEGQDPMWHQAARQTLAAVIMDLQMTQPGTWTWKSLYQLGCSTQDELMAVVSRHLPEARHLFESPGKTTQSVLINFGSNLTLVGTLAKAWGSTSPERRFSFTRWLTDENTKQRTIVLQGSGEYKELAKSYIGAIITLVSARINSPTFAENKTRRIWLFLDEFPQLGKLNDFAPLLEIGRSKGVRVVLGAQDIEQVREIYGEHTASAWMGMVGTHIFTKINSGETARYLAEDIIGERTIDRINLFEGKQQSAQRERELVLEPYELAEELGPNGVGVRAILMDAGDVYLLDWPYTNLPPKRKPSVPAAWLSSTQELPMDVVEEMVQPDFTVPTPATATITEPVTPSAPRLRLRPLSPAELTEMASSGTSIIDAADELDDLTETAEGGTHESR